MKTQRLASLGSAYVATLAALVRTEMSDDAQQAKTAMVRLGIAGGLLLLGALWLNAALLVFFLQTEYQVLGPLLVGVVLAIVGFLLMRSRKSALPSEYLAGTREVLRSELIAVGLKQPEPERQFGADLADPNRPAPVPERLSPEGAHARMRDLRIQMGQILSPSTSAHYVRGGEPPPVVGFQPKSKTMRWMCHAWQTGRSSKIGGVAGAAATLAAARYPKLRRSIAMFSLVRGLGRAAGERLRRA
ncbi:MAG TPA: phage holin family protein [Burkholderiaceae bacterium]|nr:phage holin family protein [Burkholderiaceae bacterium]